MLTSILGANKGAPNHKRHQKYINWIRRLLGVDEIDYEETKNTLPLIPEHIDMMGIGTKEDREEDGIEML